MPINEETTWEEVGSTSTGGDSHVRDAFENGTAKKVLLEPTFKLYKFNEYKTLSATDSTSVSLWWSPYEAYEWDPGWSERKHLAASLHVNIRELGRVTSARREHRGQRKY